MDNLVHVGYLSSPFGLKGEIKVISSLNHLDKIFKVNNSIIIDQKKYVVKNSRIYKNNYYITFEGYEDINKINDILKKDAYINHDDIILNDGEYLYSDLIGLDVIEDNASIGKVDSIYYNKNSDYLKVSDFLIPINNKYIIHIDLANKKIYAKDVEELRI